MDRSPYLIAAIPTVFAVFFASSSSTVRLSVIFLYTIVRIKSILNKYQEEGKAVTGLKVNQQSGESEKALMLALVKYNEMMENVYEELAPHKICAYIYDLANAFNHFYHETKILAEENEAKKQGYIALLILTKKVLESCIDVLGFEAPERM